MGKLNNGIGFFVQSNFLNNVPLTSSDNINISVLMKGQTPEAHADAILRHFGMTKVDEQAFREKYGYDLRQNLTEAYSKKDDKSAHINFGNGYYKVIIPLPRTLVAQINEIKNRNQTPATQTTNNNINQLIAERNGYDQSALIRSRLENQLPSAALVPAPAPTPLPDKSTYTSIDKVELTTTPENANKLAITIQSFLPFDRIEAPNNPFYHPLNSAIGTFDGDGANRHIGDMPFIDEKGVKQNPGFRTQQKIIIDWNMPENVEIPCQVGYQCVSNPDAGWSKERSPYSDEVVIRKDKAEGKTIQATAIRQGDTITIKASGNENIPLVEWSPGISYDLKMTIKRDKNTGKTTVETEGYHDQFPGYEIFVGRSTELSDQKLIYGFDPRQGEPEPPRVFSLPRQAAYLFDSTTGLLGEKGYSPLSLFSVDQQKVKTKTEVISVPASQTQEKDK